jgi:hypothetical protein
LRDDFVHQVGKWWAARDSLAALEWSKALTDETDRANAVKAVCIEVAQHDPGLATRQWQSHGGGDESTLGNLAQSWASRDAAAATQWALELPGDGQRDRILSHVAFAVAASDPVAAATLVANDITPGETQSEAVISILHQWALRDAKAAREWVARFPEGPLRERALKELAGAQGRQATATR